MELREYQGAVADFSEAIRLDGPRKALTYYGRGLAWCKLAELAAAAADLRQAMKLDRTLEQEFIQKNCQARRCFPTAQSDSVQIGFHCTQACFRKPQSHHPELAGGTYRYPPAVVI
jgi:tetratricopeptide (TPR) repeat protein